MQNNIGPITFSHYDWRDAATPAQQNKEKGFLTIGLNGQVHHSKEINFPPARWMLYQVINEHIMCSCK